MALNSFLVYKASCPYRYDFLQFILDVMHSLTTEHNKGAAKLANMKPLKKKPPILRDIQVPRNEHQFIKREKKKRCRVCYSIRNETLYYCPGCDGEPGLCSMAHYRIWHNQEEQMQDDTQQLQIELRPSGSRAKNRQK